MKNFIFYWFTWQVVLIGLISVSADWNRVSGLSDIKTTVDCSTKFYYAGTAILDISMPLLQFTSYTTRDCTPGTAK